jgi:aromatic-L-amino-acid decarboxylase
MNELLFNTETHREAGRLLGEFLAHYEVDLSNQPVLPPIDRDAMRAILTEPLPEEGKPLEDLFQEFREVVVPNSTNVAHPRFLPYVLPSPNGISAFADALASTLNQNCHLRQMPSNNASFPGFMNYSGFPKAAEVSSPAVAPWRT